jgi:hypothetical protein
MTRLYFHSGCGRLAAIHSQSLIDEEDADGSQRRRTYFSHRVEFRTLPRVLPQAPGIDFIKPSRAPRQVCVYFRLRRFACVRAAQAQDMHWLALSA